MNSLKTVIVVTVLLGVAYAVYSALYNGAGTTTQSRSEWPAAPGASKNGVSQPGDGPTSGSLPTNIQLDIPGGTVPPSTSRSSGGQSVSGGLRNDPDRVPPGESFAPGNALAVSDPRRAPTADGVLIPRTREKGIGRSFTLRMEAERKKLAAGDLDAVLRELSPWYGTPRLSREESQDLTDLLDQVAGAVIYDSRQHLAEAPYVVRSGDTLERIADKYSVPVALLAKINGLRVPPAPPAADSIGGASTSARTTPLKAGQELKVLRGPFEAAITLDRFELLLKVGGRYAGRFPIGVGRDPARLVGTYHVEEKFSATSRRDDVRDLGALNSMLRHPWIVLDGGIRIHGADDARNLRREGNEGWICLGARDIEDVSDILSIGSPVTIQR